MKKRHGRSFELYIFSTDQGEISDGMLSEKIRKNKL